MQASTVKKLVVVCFIACFVGAYFLFDLGQYLSLEYLKASQERFQALYADHAAFVLGGYFLVYVVSAALAFPAASVLTLAGGALFGFTVGVVVVSFASSVGASLAFVIARYLLRDWIQDRFGDKLKPVNDGIAKDGGFYLFTLRLIPVFPFFVVNALVALTPMRLFTYYWVSQLGMLPATAVYVNAGKELGQLDSLSGLFSPGLIASFVLLGVFPLFVRKTMGWVMKKRRNNG